MIEFYTPFEVMEKFVDMIEKERIRKNMTQKELYSAAGMSASAYRSFMDTKNTKFENSINLLFVLDLTSKIEELIKVEEFASLDEIKRDKNKIVRKRKATDITREDILQIASTHSIKQSLANKIIDNCIQAVKSFETRARELGIADEEIQNYKNDIDGQIERLKLVS
jgi:transcriptional regulator with XRE-family HTH domain